MKELNIMRLFLISLIISAAFFLRIYNLSAVPPILLEKEAKIGLAAQSYSIFNTADIAPLTILITAPFVKIFGLHEWSVRLPSAIFGTLSIVMIYLVSKKLEQFIAKQYSEKNMRQQQFFSRVPFISLLLISFSFWHVQVSRVDTGINAGMFFLLTGVYLLINNHKQAKGFIFLCAFLLLSVYTDYAFFIPVLAVLVGITYFQRKTYYKLHKQIGITVFLFSLLLVPIVQQSISHSVRRDDTVVYWTIFNQERAKDRISYSQNSHVSKILHHQNVEDTKLFGQRVAEYFEPQQLFFRWEQNADYISPFSGLFNPVSLLFFIAGIVFLINRSRKFLYVFFLSLLISLFPVAATRSVTDVIRTSIILPYGIIIMAFGMRTLFGYSKNKIVFGIVLVCLGIFFYSSLRFFFFYFTKYPQSTDTLHMAYKQALLFTEKSDTSYASVRIVDGTFGKNISLYFPYFVKSKFQKNIYTFVSDVPTFDAGNTLYIVPTKSVPEGIDPVFTTSGKNKETQVSIFTL